MIIVFQILIDINMYPEEKKFCVNKFDNEEIIENIDNGLCPQFLAQSY